AAPITALRMKNERRSIPVGTDPSAGGVNRLSSLAGSGEFMAVAPGGAKDERPGNQSGSSTWTGGFGEGSWPTPASQLLVLTGQDGRDFRGFAWALLPPPRQGSPWPFPGRRTLPSQARLGERQPANSTQSENPIKSACSKRRYSDDDPLPPGGYLRC